MDFSQRSTEKVLSSWGPEALQQRLRAIIAFQKSHVEQRFGWIQKNIYFYSQVAQLLEFLIEKGCNVLSIRSESGFYLNAAAPSFGLGIDLTSEMLQEAERRYPQYSFKQSNEAELKLDLDFDYVVIDHIGDTVDVSKVFDNLHDSISSTARVLILNYNYWWRPILRVAEIFKLKMALLEQNWLSDGDVRSLLTLSSFEEVRRFRIVLFPKYIPILSTFINRYIAPLPGINRLCMLSIYVARTVPKLPSLEIPSVSIIVPCKNEVDNIKYIFERCPRIGAATELIFCDDQSTDGTKAEIERLLHTRPDLTIKVVDGPGINKARNVWSGFDSASNDIVLILDADLAVMPEELSKFVRALTEGKAEFVNGSRLVYPMQQGAMKFSNMIGNTVFSYIFSFLLSQPIGDTLCGTKAFWRRDWSRMKKLIGQLDIEDKWGDYELLFSAARLQLKIIDLPVHYQERVFGTTKMVRVFQNGFRMLRICLSAFFRYRLRYLGTK